MTITEKAAYLKGLTDGLGIEPDSRDGKLWGALNELLADMAHEIEDLQATSMDYADALDEVTDELNYLEELTCDLDTPEDFEDEDDDYADDCEDCSAECGACPGCCGGNLEEDEGELVASYDGEEDEESEEDDEEELSYDGVVYDVVCPKCGEEISFDEETLAKGSITCPKCGENLEFDLDDEEEIKF